MNNPTSLPSLYIDLKKNRIRIHRHTLSLIGNPDYIQLLVNPGARNIAIRRSNKYDHLSHKVSHKGEDSVELYSLNLIKNLASVNKDLLMNRTYKIYGNVDIQAGMALFSMHNLIPLTE